MTTHKPKGRVKPKTQAISGIKNIVSGVGQRTSTQVLRIIAESGVTLPVKAELPEQVQVSKPRITRDQLAALTVFKNPDQWFLIRRAKHYQQKAPFDKFGSAFAIETRNEDGFICYYMKFDSSGSISAIGADFIAKANEAVTEIARFAKGSKASSAGRKESLKDAKNAARFPLNQIEKEFLNLISSKPNVTVALARGAQKNEWHTFRWKWQQYGFDLSQIIITQQKRPDGTMDVFGMYKPNVDGSMNEGLESFVQFLRSKPVA